MEPLASNATFIVDKSPEDLERIFYAIEKLIETKSDFKTLNWAGIVATIMLVCVISLAFIVSRKNEAKERAK